MVVAVDTSSCVVLLCSVGQMPFSCCATLAQLVEHLICNQTVVGSSPMGGSKVFKDLPVVLLRVSALKTVVVESFRVRVGARVVKGDGL